MKRFIMALLVFLLLAGTYPTSASAISAQKAADTLYELGLFIGTGVDESGNPVYNLNAIPTRAQAIVMLIRLLGEEQAALGGRWKHPFIDVDEWADPYVGYAYEKGLTNGINAASFGSNNTALPIMFLTFVLRALGYDDRGETSDFSYDEASAFALSIGLTDKDYPGDFVRGDIAIISLRALELKMNNSDVTLIESLIIKGVVDAQTAYDAGFSIFSSEDGDEDETAEEGGDEVDGISET